MNACEPLGLMGGCFDPVHKGHIELARTLAAAGGIGEVRFVIAACPPHRPPLAAPVSLRRQMLAAAIAGMPRFSIEDCELEPSGPRYTADTVALLRRRNPGRPLCWMMGFDSFATLPGWRRWRTLLDLAHLVVGARTGHSCRLPPVLRDELRARAVIRAEELRSSPAGRIMVCRQPVAEVSASRVREAARTGRLDKDLIPAPVARIIRESGAYLAGGA